MKNDIGTFVSVIENTCWRSVHPLTIVGRKWNSICSGRVCGTIIGTFTGVLGLSPVDGIVILNVRGEVWNTYVHNVVLL
jgi:uncharacterized membrane protein